MALSFIAAAVGATRHARRVADTVVELALITFAGATLARGFCLQPFNLFFPSLHSFRPVIILTFLALATAFDTGSTRFKTHAIAFCAAAGTCATQGLVGHIAELDAAPFLKLDHNLRSWFNRLFYHCRFRASLALAAA